MFYACSIIVQTPLCLFLDVQVLTLGCGVYYLIIDIFLPF